MSSLPKSIQNLIDQFAKLPGIGPKSASRITFYLLKNPSLIKDLTEAINGLKGEIKYCSLCYNLTDRDPCEICSNSKRDKSILCVVEEPLDIVAFEKTNRYDGLYFVLGGLLSPIDGIGPEKLRIKELLTRIKKDNLKEIILATSPNTEGEITANFIAKEINKNFPKKLKITRIARGLPIGADIEYADEITLSKALEGRKEIS